MSKTNCVAKSISKIKRRRKYSFTRDVITKGLKV